MIMVGPLSKGEKSLTLRPTLSRRSPPILATRRQYEKTTSP